MQKYYEETQVFLFLKQMFNSEELPECLKLLFLAINVLNFQWNVENVFVRNKNATVMKKKRIPQIV